MFPNLKSEKMKPVLSMALLISVFALSPALRGQWSSSIPSRFRLIRLFPSNTDSPGDFIGQTSAFAKSIRPWTLNRIETTLNGSTSDSDTGVY